MKMNIFADDFQGALREFTKNEVDLFNKPVATYNLLIKKFVQPEFSFVINGTAVPQWAFKGAQLVEDKISIQYTANVGNLKQIKSVKIKNTLLFKYFREQKNIVNLTILGQKRTVLFIKENENEFKEITFE